MGIVLRKFCVSIKLVICLNVLKWISVISAAFSDLQQANLIAGGLSHVFIDNANQRTGNPDHSHTKQFQVLEENILLLEALLGSETCRIQTFCLDQGCGSEYARIRNFLSYLDPLLEVLDPDPPKDPLLDLTSTKLPKNLAI
jgi:hypothetical protein